MKFFSSAVASARVSRGNSSPGGIVLKLMAAVLLLVFWCHAHANAYSDYVSNVYLLESRQAAQPDKVIRYSDPQNGPLLKSVISPDEARSMLIWYFANVRLGIRGPNLAYLLLTVANRYEESFSANPKLYESEYLDSLEFSSLILKSSADVLKEGNAQESSSPILSEETKQILDTARKIRATSAKLMSTFQADIARKIREQADKRMFSAEGEKRALEIAERLDPKEPPIAYKDMTMQQKVAYGEKLFMSNCAVCHRKDGKGISGFTPSLVGAPSLTSSASIGILINGRRSMPASWNKVLSDADIAALVTYMRSKFSDDPENAATESEVREEIVQAGTAK